MQTFFLGSYRLLKFFLLMALGLVLFLALIVSFAVWMNAEVSQMAKTGTMLALYIFCSIFFFLSIKSFVGYLNALEEDHPSLQQSELANTRTFFLLGTIVPIAYTVIFFLASKGNLLEFSKTLTILHSQTHLS